MDDHLDFVVYCIEEYKFHQGLSGREVIERFNRYGVIDYITSTYDALHTTGGAYIAQDLQAFIDARAKPA